MVSFAHAERWTDFQEVDQVVGAGVLARVARVLVLGPDRLDEADRLDPAVRARVGGELLELLLVAQMLRARRRARARTTRSS